jgi:ATP-dependent helicase/nuclease subunit B
VLFQSERTKATARPVRRIYTVPHGRLFLDALAEALLAGNLPVPGGRRIDPLALADVTLLLPTRRATRALQEAFLKASRGGALLLPKIRPIFATSEDLTPFLGVEDLSDGGAADIPPAVGDLERQLLLAKLVLRWAEAERGGRGRGADIAPYSGTTARTPAQAAKLAGELARLMDQMDIEDVDPEKMETVVPGEFSEHWDKTLEFLKIVTINLPAMLDGRSSKMQHDKALILAQAKRLREAPPSAPVIVAGVMSSVPAVTELLRAVAGLPNGALVLPSLDKTLDDESWRAISPAHPEHPQFGLKKLLDALGVPREDVLALPGPAPHGAQQSRSTLVSEAMRPVSTTERWHHFTSTVDKRRMADALAGVALIEAPSAEDEAEAIALILREVAETPGRTAALVSPDRQLARRVSVRLQAWGLIVDDSAGHPFAKFPLGAFLDLVIEAAATRFQPIALAALLKHPLCRLGLAPKDLSHAARALELAVFRAPYFGQGLGGIADALTRAEAETKSGTRRHRAVRQLKRAEWQVARDLTKRITKVFQPLDALFAKDTSFDLRVLAKAHVAAAEALARTDNKAAETTLWRGEAGEWAAKFFASLIDAGLPAPDMPAADYAEFYRGLTADASIRPRAATHPRIFIWEPFESRLQQPDVVVLGSLNEGTWPQAADPGPWLNRPMRALLGLPAPEERIGDAAHIFASLLGVERVYLTRAAKIDGVPTVPSRWLLRLEALLEGLGKVPAPDQPWLDWAHARNALDAPPRPVRAPEPRPPVAMRPRQLSVTTIEKWIANPYAIFAERILGLAPLPALGQKPDAALRGQIVHEALGRFARAFPDRLPADVFAELMTFAEAALADCTGSPRVAAFWAPRFARFAAWFAETEAGRRQGIDTIHAEVDGAKVLAGPAGAFTLKARADRIDAGAKGLVVTDYKTAAGLATLKARAEQGEGPQLPLEAAIAVAGGFTGLPAQPVAALRYISASGGEPAGAQFNLNGGDMAALARRAEEGLVRLIDRFDRPETPYRALRRARFNFAYKYDDYAHLARVAEWSAETVEEE